MSSSLVWGLIRDTNCFLVKRGRTSRDQEIQLSTESGNLLSAKTAKYTGVANTATIDLSQGVNAKGNKCVVLKKKSTKATKSAGVFDNKNVYTMKQLNANLKGYRADLHSAAQAKFTKLAKGAIVANGRAKGAKKQSNRRGKVADFTFGKLESYRGHVRDAASA